MTNNEVKIEELKEDLSKIKDLNILGDTAGGKELVKVLVTDIITSIDDLVSNRETLSHQGFIAIACDIKTRLDVVRSITRAKKNKIFLEELLKEALQE